MFTEVTLGEALNAENQLEPASLIVDKTSILGRGRGRFGSVTPVYRGTYEGTPVVIKQLTVVEGLVSNSEASEILKRIHILSTIRDTRLVSFFGACVTVPTEEFSLPSLCVVAELMPMGSLHELLHTTKLEITLEERLTIAVQVSEGVAFLHGLTPILIHQRLKSSNVLLDETMNAKLCDFGLTHLTQHMMRLDLVAKRDHGSEDFIYIAPELFEPEENLTDRSDVWALGCVVVETLTGRLPWDGQKDAVNVWRRIVQARQLPFSEWTQVPSAVQTLAQQAFTFDPKDRINAVHFLAGLKICASHP